MARANEQRAEDRRRLDMIRARWEQMTTGDWAIADDGGGMLLDALEQTGGGTARITLARFTSLATIDEAQLIASAPADIRFLLGLIDRAIAVIGRMAQRKEAPAPQERQRKDYAAEAAMKCQEPAFKRFLMERYGLESPATDDRTAQRLRGILRVSSRRELNDDGHAAERWKALRSEFDAWRRVG